MYRKISRTVILQLTAVLLIAAALKLHYSTSGVNALRWILAPTTALVELITGVRFAFESHAGYMSSDYSFLIAPSCAGVNFLIAAFVMLAFGRLWQQRNWNIGWRFIPFSLLAAYLTTIIANAVRISTALQFRHLDSKLAGLNPEQLHRVEGILIYFGFLLLLFMVSEKANAETSSSRRLAAWRRWVLPIAVYYATTLGMPLATGAYRLWAAEFLEHSLFVAFTPLLLLLPILGLGFIKHLRAPKATAIEVPATIFFQE